MAIDTIPKGPDPRGEDPKPSDTGQPVKLTNKATGTVVTASGDLVKTLESQGYERAGSKAAPKSATPADGPPPKSGAGSGRDAWATYANEKGVKVDADATREDIVAALDAAGVPTA